MAGLRWMVLAQLCFAGMNVCTRLGASHLPWAEIAAARFLIGAVIAVGGRAVAGKSRFGSPTGRDLAAQHLRHPGGPRYVLRAGLARVGVGDAATFGDGADLRGAAVGSPARRAGRAPALAGGGLAFAGIVALLRPSFADRGAGRRGRDRGAFFYALAMIWLRRIGPGESHEAVVLHFSLVGLATMVMLAMPRGPGPTARARSTCSAPGLGGGGAQLAMTRAYSLQRAAPVTAL